MILRAFAAQLRRLNAAGAAGTAAAAARRAASGGGADDASATSGAASAAGAEFIVLPMPKLSHEMKVGKLARWLKREGDPVAQYDLLCEVETTQLVEEAYRMGDFAGAVTLLIESQEDCVFARRLAPEGATLAAGTPIALLCEALGSGGGGDSGDGGAGGGGSSSGGSGSGGAEAGGGGGEALVAAAARHRVPTSDVYDESQPRARVLEWQSYLKESREEPGCSKCMG